MTLYRKATNRSLSLLSAQYWEKGDREATQGICEGVFLFTPFLWYRAGKGVGAYYNWTDPKQDPRRLVEYFNAHPETFYPLEQDYLERYEKITQVIQNGDPKDFEWLFHETVRIWPMITIASLLGKWDPAELNADIVKRCFDLRMKTDRIYYDINAAMLVMAEKITGRTDVDFLRFEEIVSSTFPNSIEMARRQKGYVLFEGKLTTSENVIAFAKSVDIELADNAVDPTATELRGQTAWPGSVRGIVRVIYERSQLPEFKAGEILVAPMTTPDFLPAMKIASAFVTDEGGITCHAAIVAREMKVPCVVGTLAATATLHTGDEVEIDTDQGLVRILKRAHEVEM